MPSFALSVLLLVCSLFHLPQPVSPSPLHLRHVLTRVTVYFVYPETCGVRLEDMDALFGDATANLGTPVAPGTPSLGATGTPSAIGRGGPVLGPSFAIPGLDIDPPDVVDRKNDHRGNGGVTGWFSRVLGRGGSSDGEYAPVGQRED